MNDLISRQAAIDAIEAEEVEEWIESDVDFNHGLEMARSIVMSLPSAEPKTDGVFVKGGLTISGEPPMPEGCMDCKIQDRCLCIPPDLSADEISELYISRRPNCPLSIVKEPETGHWIRCKEQDEADLDNGNALYKCSNCGHTDLHAETQEVPYCWFCGSDMRGEEE